jgi:hypothetical protein
MRCTLAADLLQACETSGTRTTCWLVTCGVRQTMEWSGDHATGRPGTGRGDAALWGFGRTMMNEALDLTVRLVDLERPDAAEAVAALVREFDHQDQEQEVALTARATGLFPACPSSPDTRSSRSELKPGDHDPSRFRFSGKLRNLRWQTHPQAVLGDNELEVEVRATGLNFRDLMFTLGLLSDEAIENGFAGRPGAGVLRHCRRVGSPEGGFAPGDKVVGFGRPVLPTGSSPPPVPLPTCHPHFL